jgi:hypothetical protein
MRLIYAKGFSKAEREEWRHTILENLLTALKYILEAMQEREMELANKENQVSLEKKKFFSSPIIAMKLSHGA